MLGLKKGVSWTTRGTTEEVSLCGSEGFLSLRCGKNKKVPEGDSEQNVTVPALSHLQKSPSLATNFKGNLP